jgi:hypothetical protein
LGEWAKGKAGRIQGPSATDVKRRKTRSTVTDAVEKMENKERFPLSHHTATAIFFIRLIKLVALGI